VSAIAHTFTLGAIRDMHAQVWCCGMVWRTNDLDQNRHICLICVSPCVFPPFLDQLQSNLATQYYTSRKAHTHFFGSVLSANTLCYSCDYLCSCISDLSDTWFPH